VPYLVRCEDPMGCHWAANANSPPTIPTKPKREPNQMRRLGSAVLRYDGGWTTVRRLPKGWVRVDPHDRRGPAIKDGSLEC
jgi:hypothetical protein